MIIYSHVYTLLNCTWNRGIKQRKLCI